MDSKIEEDKEKMRHLEEEAKQSELDHHKLKIEYDRRVKERDEAGKRAADVTRQQEQIKGEIERMNQQNEQLRNQVAEEIEQEKIKVKEQLKDTTERLEGLRRGG